MSSEHIEVVHHQGHDTVANPLFVPGIRVRSGEIVFFSGVTAAPAYHEHPHREEDFDGVPEDAGEQARLAYEHLDEALAAAGCRRQDVVQLTRFFTDCAHDQDAINRVQGEFFAGHLPTSTTVEVTRLTTDPRLKLEIQAVAVRRP